MRLVILLLALLLPATVRSSEIEGHIYNTENHQPIRDVNVYVPGTNIGTVSDSLGYFRLRGIASREVTVKFSAIGFKEQVQTVSFGSVSIVTITVYLTPTILYQSEVTVTATRNAMDPLECPIATNIINRTILEHRNTFGIGDVLQQQAGVTASSTGPGSIRPVIRGLYDAQVLTLLNGIPLMDLRAGGDHVLLLEPDQIERVEIVRGPGTVLYGSDAIGGVVNFITQPTDPFTLNQLALRGQLSVGYSSLGGLCRGTGEFALGSNSLYFLGRYGIKKSGNISDPEREIPNSSYNGQHVDLFGGWQTGPHELRIGYHYLKADVGVPINPFARHSMFEGEQQHFLKLSDALKVSLPVVSNIDINATWQRHLRHFHLITPDSQSPDSVEQDLNIYLDVHAYTGQIILNSIPFSNILLKCGIDLVHQTASSDRTSFLANLITRSQMNLTPPRVIPNSSRTDIGVFSENEVTIGKLSLFGGFRYDWLEAHSFQTDRSPIVPSTPRDQSYSGNLGLVYHLPHNINLPIDLGRAFRSPTLLERYFCGPHQSTVDKGNPDLKPETSLNIDLGLSQKRDCYEWRVNIFQNIIDEYIGKMRTGIIDQATGLQIDTWQNISQARLRGIEVEGAIHINEGVGVYSTLSYVEGTDTKTNAPLQYIPPLNGNITVRHSALWGTSEMSILFAAAQNRLSPLETETGASAIVNLSHGFDLPHPFPKRARLNMRVENLLNTKYHNHLSRIKEWYYQPGRNVSLSMIVEM